MCFGAYAPSRSNRSRTLNRTTEDSSAPSPTVGHFPAQPERSAAKSKARKPATIALFDFAAGAAMLKVSGREHNSTSEELSQCHMFRSSSRTQNLYDRCRSNRVVSQKTQPNSNEVYSPYRNPTDHCASISWDRRKDGRENLARLSPRSS